MNKSRLGSLIEAMFNTAIGLAISMIANALIYPQFGFHPTLGENFLLAVIYTIISIARGYFVRRFFNARLHRAASALAAGAVATSPTWHITEHEGAEPD